MWSKEVGLTVGCVCVVERGWSNCGMCVWSNCGMYVWSKEVGLTVGCVCGRKRLV